MLNICASNQFGAPNQTDVFVVGRNGTLSFASAIGSGPWSGPATIGLQNSFPPSAAVAASSQFGTTNPQTDVFAVDNNGTLQVAFAIGGGGWSPLISIGAQGLFPPGAAVAASSQFGATNPQTDVFAVDNNGALQVAFAIGSGGWSPMISIGPQGLFPPGAAVAASKRFGATNPQTDVFAVDNNGTLQVASAIGSSPWSSMSPIGPQGLFPSGAAVAASKRFGVPNQTDVFAVDSNGTLQVASVVSSGAWTGPTPISPAGFFPPGAAVAASNHFGDSERTDVFVIDANGDPNIAWVVNGAWNGPNPVSGWSAI
jgi:hypothetical protein